MTNNETAAEPVAFDESTAVAAPALADDTAGQVGTAGIEPVAAVAEEELAAHKADEPESDAATDRELKAWVRRNIHWLKRELDIIATGAGEDERAALNP